MEEDYRFLYSLFLKIGGYIARNVFSLYGSREYTVLKGCATDYLNRFFACYSLTFCTNPTYPDELKSDGSFFA